MLTTIAGCGIQFTRVPSAADEVQAIRDARLAQNEAIVEQDLDAIARYWERGVRSTAGTGVFVTGRAEYRRAFADEFRNLDDVLYSRIPEFIELSSAGVSNAEKLASESGTWTGSWISSEGPMEMSGVYSAMWRKRNGRWRIRSELFVALSCTGADCL
jgi:ketosteroid isomerase-like protein